VLARAPGRVNLIGDHTDYTGGLCLPIAIDRWVEVEGRGLPASSTIRLYSAAADSSVEISLPVHDLAQVKPEWGRYVAAVAARLPFAGGWDGVVRSTVPMGMGLSSSAALEVASALAFGGRATDRLALAALCRDAEHAARGVRTGLLDQLASLFGVADHALLIDTATNVVSPIPLPPSSEAEVVVLPGSARHLAASGYPERVDECRRAEDEIGPLRSATLVDVEALGDPVLRRRARHVVSENARVRDYVAALAEGRVVDAGRLMDGSHRSLRDDYESSTPVIDALCDALQRRPGVLGARITGGGWGGCVVALARPGVLAEQGWVVRAVDGASVAQTSG
jgi:galactokinase